MHQSPPQLPSWQRLITRQKQMAGTHLQQLFQDDPQRAQRYRIEAAQLHLDYSKHLICDDVMQDLYQLAQESQLQQAIADLFQGQPINTTEQRPALHTALREPGHQPIEVEGNDIVPQVHSTLAHMEQLVNAIHSNQHLGYTGKPLRTIVAIGIGGSYLGPQLVADALQPYHFEGFSLHYLVNIDGAAVQRLCQQLDAQQTLFIVCSKSFTTLETLKNTQACRHWFLQQGGSEADIARHFIAITSQPQRAIELGIVPEHIFPMWDWVGGRFSLWSAIGLPPAIVLGMDVFKRLLAGAHQMDQHFQQAPWSQNMPITLALLGIWYHNFFNAQSYAVLPYDDSLARLPAHLQQLDMESNGKRVSHQGQPVSWSTGPIVWGGVGTQGQHAYHQLLHQGTHLIPIDFILPLSSHYPLSDHHTWLAANCLAQAQAMLSGQQQATLLQNLLAQGMDPQQAARLALHKTVRGNQPNSMITLPKLTPETLGALIALYEHRVFVQGVIWQIDSFDQWGVELGKVLGQQVFHALCSGDLQGLDSSTAEQVKAFRSMQLQSGL